MPKSCNRTLVRWSEFSRDQRGITGLETAIVLIAFVVVASVFAFAVLSTGFLSAEKSKEAVLGGLEETSSTLNVRGDIIGENTWNRAPADGSITGGDIFAVAAQFGHDCS